MKSVRTVFFGNADDVPNNTLPVLLYRRVLAANAADKAKLLRERFKSNGWTGIWTDTIYDYTHFHSNAHEVLGVAEGAVSLRLGGEAGLLFRLKAGDMLILARRGRSSEGRKRQRPQGRWRIPAWPVALRCEA